MNDKTPSDCLKVLTLAFQASIPTNDFYISQINQYFDGTNTIKFVLNAINSSITITVNCKYNELPRIMETLGFLEKEMI